MAGGQVFSMRIPRRKWNVSMLGWIWRRAHLKRRSIARCCRAFQFHSQENHSRVAATLRFLAAASAIRLLQVSGHHFEVQLLEFLFERRHRIPFRLSKDEGVVLE
jgi:hypothetical protein